MPQSLDLNPDDVFLAQGTLRPDLIESASLEVSKKADAIKTHHNDTELVRELRARVGAARVALKLMKSTTAVSNQQRARGYCVRLLR
jgi:hypothetical protein